VSIYTLTLAEADARLLAQDTNPAGSGQGLVSAEYASLINRVYLGLAEMLPERFSTLEDVTLSAASTDWSPTSSVNVRRVTTLSIDGGADLEWTPLAHMRYKQNVVGGTGTPTRWSTYQDTNQTASDNRWKLLLWKAPTGATDCVVGFQFYPPELSNPSDKLRFPDAECRWITQITAAFAAVLNGNDDQFIAKILMGLPDNVRRHMAVDKWIAQERVRKEAVREA
jgi:hypothetical protein